MLGAPSVGTRIERALDPDVARLRELSDDTWTLESHGVCAVIDLVRGGRLASLRVADLELLVGPDEPDAMRSDAMRWGSFPMAPWAGRVREGRFRFDGREWRLPLDLPPHAIHGTVWKREWKRDGDTLTCELGPDWPFGGHAVQRLALDSDALHLTLELHATSRSFPASCGWHPWFRRRLARGDTVRIDLRAGFMAQRDATGIPDGARVTPPAGPWDDCFGALAAPPRLVWPGALEISLESSCDYVVVYDRPQHAVCVEPHTAPPDALNRAAALVEPGRPLIATSVWRWRLDREEPAGIGKKS